MDHGSKQGLIAGSLGFVLELVVGMGGLLVPFMTGGAVYLSMKMSENRRQGAVAFLIAGLLASSAVFLQPLSLHAVAASGQSMVEYRLLAAGKAFAFGIVGGMIGFGVYTVRFTRS